MRRLPGPRTLLPAARALLPTRANAVRPLSPRPRSPEPAPTTGADVPFGPSAAPHAVAALTAWTDHTWALTPKWCAAAAADLDAQQRLLLGMVAFGPARYRNAALSTGLTPAEVSAHCTAALQHLSAARSPVR